MTFFELAWTLRGYDELMLDIKENQEFVELLLNKILSVRKDQARKFAQAGVDILHIGDDVCDVNGLLFDYDYWKKTFNDLQNN